MWDRRERRERPSISEKDKGARKARNVGQAGKKGNGEIPSISSISEKDKGTRKARKVGQARKKGNGKR